MQVHSGNLASLRCRNRFRLISSTDGSRDLLGSRNLPGSRDFHGSRSWHPWLSPPVRKLCKARNSPFSPGWAPFPSPSSSLITLVLQPWHPKIFQGQVSSLFLIYIVQLSNKFSVARGWRAGTGLRPLSSWVVRTGMDTCPQPPSGRTSVVAGGKYLLVLSSDLGSGRGGSSSPCIEPNSCLLDLNSCNRKTSVWRWRCSALTNRWQSCLMVFDLTEWFISSAFEQPIWFNFPLQCFTENDKNVLLHKACESVNEHKCAVLFTY